MTERLCQAAIVLIVSAIACIAQEETKWQSALSSPPPVSSITTGTVPYNTTTNTVVSRPVNRNAPLVIMEQTAANGKVIYFTDSSDEGEMKPAVMLPVEIWTREKAKRIYKTVTDRDGAYSFPALSAGTYRLMVGRLNLGLQVRDRGPEGGIDSGQKVILIYIPRELGEVGGKAGGS